MKRCQAPSDPYKGKCNEPAAVVLSNGTKLCKSCARLWAETRIEAATTQLRQARTVLAIVEEHEEGTPR